MLSSKKDDLNTEVKTEEFMPAFQRERLNSFGNPNKSREPKCAIIFDCDGVLVDTEVLKHQAWEKALAVHEVSFTVEDYMPLIGGSSKKIMAAIAEQKKLTLNNDQVIAQKNEIYDRLQKEGVTPIPDAVFFLKELIENKHQYNIKLGLASSAPTLQILENLRQIGVNPKDLDAIVSGSDDLKHINDPNGTNKPKPYIYNLISEKLAINAKDCIVLEDSEAGVVAGADAGMIVIAVPNQFTRNHNFSKAKIITEFKEITFSKLDGIRSAIGFKSKQ